jgi:diadenosine tetraphosphate (Ap4A) HIT family hydrolase
LAQPSDAGHPDCPFCAIVRGEESTKLVCEGETWIAFFPLQPATAGHTLIVPRRHVPDLWSADPELAAALINAAIHVGRAIETAVTPDGMNLITSSGAEAEQTVFHLHLHVVPRYRDDGFDEIWPSRRDLPGVDLEEVAQRIREACDAV